MHVQRLMHAHLTEENHAQPFNLDKTKFQRKATKQTSSQNKKKVK